MKRYKQGIYRPIHQEKYRGSQPICYRSSLELRFMRFCDTNSNIITWGSESVVLPYIRPTDGKLHRYFVDNNLVIKDKEGTLHKYLVEIKPYKQTLPPSSINRKNKGTLLKEQFTYAINMAKFQAAKQWCAKQGWKFMIITEKDLNKLK